MHKREDIKTQYESLRKKSKSESSSKQPKNPYLEELRLYYGEGYPELFQDGVSQEKTVKPAKTKKLLKKQTAVKVANNRQRWNERYAELEAYKEANGNCNVPKKYPPNPQLASWVYNQRRDFNNFNSRREKMSPERIKKLKEVGFSWNTFTDQWEAKYKELCAYKEKHGHCNVPRTYLNLGNWIQIQKVSYKKGQLSKDRIDRLNEINFSWQKRADQWDTKYEKLCAYQKEHGDCNVPARYPELGNWVSTQRAKRKNKTMSLDCIEKLNKIGFKWRIK